VKIEAASLVILPGKLKYHKKVKNILFNHQSPGFAAKSFVNSKERGRNRVEMVAV